MNIYNLISAVRHRVPIPTFVSDYVADRIADGAFEFCDLYLENIIIDDVEPIINRVFDSGDDGFWITCALTRDDWNIQVDDKHNPNILCPIILVNDEIIIGSNNDLDICPAYELVTPATPITLPFYQPMNGVHPGFEDSFYAYHQVEEVDDNLTGCVCGLIYWTNVVAGCLADYFQELGYTVKNYNSSTFVCGTYLDYTSFKCYFPDEYYE